MCSRPITALLLSLGMVGVVLLWPLGTVAYALPPWLREHLLTVTQPATDTPPPPTPTATPTSTSPPAVVRATPVPTAIPTPTPALEEQVLALLSTNWPVVAAGCGGLMLIAALFLLLRPRRPKQPTPRPTKPLTPEGPYLEGSTVSGQQLRFALKPEGCTIGREPSNDLVITADLPGWETVSRRHARLYAQAGRWIVEDLNSMNGIYVNGRRTGRNLLYDGWELRIGGVVFTFHTGAGGGLI